MNFVEEFPKIKYLVRHIRKEYFTSHVAGDLFFDTTYNLSGEAAWKNSEEISARLQDHMEGKSSGVFSFSGSVVKDTQIGGMIIEGGTVKGNMHLSTFYNHRCVCFSIGAYNKARALDFIARGNNDLYGYVVYDAAKLMRLLYLRLALTNQEVVADQVRYDKSLLSKKIDGASQNIYLQNNATTWRMAMFSKPSEFMHEEEFRAIIIDNPWTNLSLEAQGVLLKRVARRAVIRSGRIVP